jgi:hypothetical protein
MDDPNPNLKKKKAKPDYVTLTIDDIAKFYTKSIDDIIDISLNCLTDDINGFCKGIGFNYVMTSLKLNTSLLIYKDNLSGKDIKELCNNLLGYISYKIKDDTMTIDLFCAKYQNGTLIFQYLKNKVFFDIDFYEIEAVEDARRFWAKQEFEFGAYDNDTETYQATLYNDVLWCKNDPGTYSEYTYNEILSSLLGGENYDVLYERLKNKFSKYNVGSIYSSNNIYLFDKIPEDISAFNITKSIVSVYDLKKINRDTLKATIYYSKSRSINISDIKQFILESRPKAKTVNIVELVDTTNNNIIFKEGLSKMEFYTFTQFRNTHIPVEMSNVKYKINKGLIPYGAKTDKLKEIVIQNLQSYVNNPSYLLSFANTIMVFKGSPQYNCNNLIGIYYLTEERDGYMEFKSFYAKEEYYEDILKHIIYELHGKNKYWRTMINNNHFSNLGFVSGLFTKTMKTNGCYLCSENRERFLNPENNHIFCSVDCANALDRQISTTTSIKF